MTICGYSLHIGVNRTKCFDSPLKGCHSDALRVCDLAIKLGYNSQALLSEDATYKNVTDAIQNTAIAMKPGDIFLISYSGHGAQTPDDSEDETDNLDEHWILYDKALKDDELWRLWAKFPEDSRIVILSDSCHSGSVSDDWSPGCEIKASGILISACQDSEYAYDTELGGIFTDTLLKVLSEGFKGSYRELKESIAYRLFNSMRPNLLIFGARDISNQLALDIKC